MFTGLSWKQWNKNDIIFGIIVPIIVVLIIVAFASIRSLIGPGSMESLGVVIGITMEITELTIIVAIPLMLGLVWNRWAGGASGFLMGTFLRDILDGQFKSVRRRRYNPASLHT